MWQMLFWNMKHILITVHLCHYTSGLVIIGEYSPPQLHLSEYSPIITSRLWQIIVNYTHINTATHQRLPIVCFTHNLEEIFWSFLTKIKWFCHSTCKIFHSLTSLTTFQCLIGTTQSNDQNTKSDHSLLITTKWESNLKILHTLHRPFPSMHSKIHFLTLNARRWVDCWWWADDHR